VFHLIYNHTHRYDHFMTTANLKITDFETCLHTCLDRDCTNPTTGCLLWKKNAAIRRHGCAAAKHPKCDDTCPGNEWLVHKYSADSSRAPTEEEWQAFILQNDDEEPFMTIVAPPVNVYGDACFKILFVADPNLVLHSKAAAKNDLAYLQTTISNDEYTAVSELDGCVHLISRAGSRVKVIIQEWVRQHRIRSDYTSDTRHI